MTEHSGRPGGESGNALLKQLMEERKANYRNGVYGITQVAFAFNSNKLEGSRLSEEDTYMMFDTQLVQPGLSVRVDDIIEMNNHFILFNRMLDTVQEEWSEGLVKEFHGILKKGTVEDAALFSAGW